MTAVSSRYLLRFDDVCASMDWTTWDRIEAILSQANVNPMVAVVPDNRDIGLAVSPPNPAFWQRVREWQARGWTIGMHGYQHEYVSRNPGILGLNAFSEFAGLPYEQQLGKLKASLNIFHSHHVQPKVWIAPGHSFDRNTVKALDHVGVHAICDGYAIWPYRDRSGIFWLPQQLWRFRTAPVGVWTVCLHANRWTDTQIGAFKAELMKFRSKIMDFDYAQQEYGERSQSTLDELFDICFRLILKWRRKLRRRALQ